MSTSKAASTIKDKFAKMSTKSKVIIGVILALFLLGSCSSSEASNSITAQVDEPSVLSFTVSADTWEPESEELIVLVEGKDDSGNKVSEQYRAVPGTKYDTDLNPGTYTIALAQTKPTKGDSLYTYEKADIKYDGKSNVNAVLTVKLDSAAMEAAEAEKAAEAQKKAEEEKAAAEKAAAEEAKAKQQASSSSSSSKASSSSSSSSSAQSSSLSGGSDATVYIASSGNGNKYHSKSTCSRMKNATAITEKQARSRGLTPCSKCM